MFGSGVSDHQTDITDIRQLAKEILKNNFKIEIQKTEYLFSKPQTSKKPHEETA